MLVCIRAARLIAASLSLLSYVSENRPLLASWTIDRMFAQFHMSAAMYKAVDVNKMAILESRIRVEMGLRYPRRLVQVKECSVCAVNGGMDTHVNKYTEAITKTVKMPIGL